MLECLLMRELGIIGGLIISWAVLGAGSARQLIVRSGHAHVCIQIHLRARATDRCNADFSVGNLTKSCRFPPHCFRTTRGLSVVLQLKLLRRIRENNPRHKRLLCTYFRNSRFRRYTPANRIVDNSGVNNKIFSFTCVKRGSDYTFLLRIKSTRN